jgi:hexosaminidase
MIARRPFPMLATLVALQGCRGSCAGEGQRATAGTLDGIGDAAHAAHAAHAADGGTASNGVLVVWSPDGSTQSPGRYRYLLSIENRRTEALAEGWRLYFTSSSAPEVEDSPDGGTPGEHAQGLRCVHGDAAQSGDYFVLEPLPSFTPINPGETRVVRMVVSGGSIQKTEAPAAFHVLLPGMAAPVAVHASTTIDVHDGAATRRGPDDALPLQTARVRYQENAALKLSPVEVRSSLLPTPAMVHETGGQFVLTGASAVVHAPDALRSEARYLEAMLGDVVSGVAHRTSVAPAGDATISLALDPHFAVAGHGKPDAEGYALAVRGADITITGTDAAGVLHGIETLRQLIPIEAYRAASAGGKPPSVVLPTVEIVDAPLFAYRGMQLDVARHFQSKDTVKKLLDLLAAHKLNKLHFHLSDDEGWRLQIPGLPELTEYGARRAFDPSESQSLHPGMGSTTSLEAADGIAGKPIDEAEANGGRAPSYQGFEEATLNFVGQGSGYYTAADFTEIIAYAAERHIDVVPEFDMPAHARAAVRSMEHRYRTSTDPRAASEYRLVDPEDRTAHTSVQGYVDNLMNPCLGSTYAFVAKVWAEVKAMFAAAGSRLVMAHVGGDEPPGDRWWRDSPACRANPETSHFDDRAIKNYFFRRVRGIVTGLGATMTGWDDVLDDASSPLPGFVPMPWNNLWGEGHEDAAYKEANAGHRVVLAHATNLYMDLAYNKDPDEPGSDWGGYVDEQRTFEYLPFDIYAIATQDRMGHTIAPDKWANATRLTPRGKDNILGLEGLLWSENVKTPALLEYMSFPKILGVAERAWNREVPDSQGLPPAWERFANTLGQAELPRLDYFHPVDIRRELSPAARPGVNYRIPLPGAVLRDGRLRANVRYPGMVIEYSTDGGATWKPYTTPTDARPPILVRAKTSDGRAGRAAPVE